MSTNTSPSDGALQYNYAKGVYLHFVSLLLRRLFLPSILKMHYAVGDSIDKGFSLRYNNKMKINLSESNKEPPNSMSASYTFSYYVTVQSQSYPLREHTKTTS